MSSTQQFEDRFAGQLRAYAAHGAPRLGREHVTKAVAAGLASRRARRLRWATLPRAFTARAAAASLAVLALTMGLAIWAGQPTDVTPGPSVSPTESAPPTPMASPSIPAPTAPGTAPAGDLHGWPSTGKNAPGTYSLDHSLCASFCIEGWMHNGNASGDVEVQMWASAFPLQTWLGGSARAVTIGAHEAMYRTREGEEQVTEQEWIFETDGMWARVVVSSQAGTSQADLDQAYAIVASVRNEPGGGAFRLVFTLTTSDWDSG